MALHLLRADSKQAISVLGRRTLSACQPSSTSQQTRTFVHQTSSRRSDQLKQDINHAKSMVHGYDPAGYLPGFLLPTSEMTETYFAVRSFWVETGLRSRPTSKLSSAASPEEHLEWWREGIDQIFDKNNDGDIPERWDHPTLRLLKHLQMRNANLSKHHLDTILSGRKRDLDVKQYLTMLSLVEHARLSCGNLFHMVLESGHVTNPKAYEAALLVGTCHGISNALRLSIPIVSTTGRLIVPLDLCQKYGVRSPRYLLSALALGDQECRLAFQKVIQHIATEARSNLERARDLRADLLSHEDGKNAVAVLLPGLAAEAFLNRLELASHDLTDRNLRNVGFLENMSYSFRMISAYYSQVY